VGDVWRKSQKLSFQKKSKKETENSDGQKKRDQGGRDTNRVSQKGRSGGDKTHRNRKRGNRRGGVNPNQKELSAAEAKKTTTGSREENLERCMGS